MTSEQRAAERFVADYRATPTHLARQACTIRPTSTTPAGSASSPRSTASRGARWSRRRSTRCARSGIAARSTPTARPATAPASISRSRRTSSASRSRGGKDAGGRLAVGMVFLPRTDFAGQERCRTIVETEILGFGYAILGWRQVPVDTSVIGEKAIATRPEIEQIIVGNAKDGERRRVRARAVPDPPAHREAGAGRAHQRLLHLLAVVPVDHLQGPVPGRAAVGVLSRPAGRALHLQLRGVPSALLDQHLAVVAAGAAVPHARAQRRDQYAARQPQLDEEPRDAHGGAGVRRVQRARQADRPDGQLRQRRAGCRGRGPGARRALAAARQDAADPAGVGAQDGHPAGAQGPVQLLQLRDGAVGRAGRGGRLRRPLGGRGHGSQRPAAHALHAHRRRSAGGRLRDRHGAAAARQHRRAGPGRTRRDDRGRPAGGRVLPRSGAQGSARRREALRPVGAEHHASRRSGRPPACRAGADGARRAAPAPESVRHLARGARAAARADGARRQGGGGLDGRRHAHGGAVVPLPRAASLLPPAVQPGDQSADRSVARIPGDEPEDPLRQSRQRLRRGAQPDARSCCWRARCCCRPSSRPSSTTSGRRRPRSTARSRSIPTPARCARRSAASAFRRRTRCARATSRSC